ncbi:MAG: hypothetical protein RSG92_15410 [Pseudomonas sp.]
MNTWHAFRPTRFICPDHTSAMSFWQSRAGIDPKQLIDVREFARALTPKPA